MSDEFVSTIMDMSEEEVRASIIRYLIESKRLTEEQKSFNSSIKDAKKELEERIDACLEVLRRKQNNE